MSGVSRAGQREWDQMNAENAKAAQTSTTGGRPVVTNGNTGRGSSSTTR
jgi:hypothetical protein